MASNTSCPFVFPKEKKNKPKAKSVLRSHSSTLSRKSKMVIEEGIKQSPVMSIRSLCSFHMEKRGLCLNPDCDSEPDRSNPLWKVLPDKVNEDEVKSEVSDDVKNHKPNLWNEIMIEYEDKRLEFDNYLELSKSFEPPLPVYSKLSAVQYLDKYIFPLLCPALEETLLKAKEWECLNIQKGRFNGLDYISELLWNRNPLHPKRLRIYRNIFEIPFAIIWLYYNPRPIYPLSWLWTKEEAITVLQSYIRRYLVCKETDCFEMRQFWKTMRMEEEEKLQARIAKSIELTEVMFNEILNKLICDAVFEVEWNLHGCRCVKKPCHCICKCMKWCKCCRCYKIPPHITGSCSCAKLKETSIEN